jgi:hypothetical protein
MPRVFCDQMTAASLLFLGIMRESEARDRVKDRHRVSAVVDRMSGRAQSDGYITAPSCLLCLLYRHPARPSYRCTPSEPKQAHSLTSSNMKLFTTAVLALLPALGSAHCVAQRVRVNGAVRLHVFPPKTALLLITSLGQWPTRWYSDSHLQQPHPKCK